MRDKRIRKLIVVAVSVLLIAVLLAVGRDQHRKGSVYLKNLTLQAEKEGFDIAWLKETFRHVPEQNDDEEDRDTNTRKYSFAAWTQCRKESIHSESGGRGCSADIIVVYGASGCVFPVGRNILASDPAGCILGKKLSEELFGSDHAEGQKLVWQDHEWTVRGIVEEPSELCILQAGDLADQLVFDRISLVMKAGDDRRQAGEEFILQQGLSAHTLRFDHLYGMGWLNEMIPSDWSDFDGWKQNLEEHGKAVKLAKTTERTVIEETGLSHQRWGRIFLASGIVFSMIGLGVIRRRWRKSDIF